MRKIILVVVPVLVAGILIIVTVKFLKTKSGALLPQGAVSGSASGLNAQARSLEMKGNLLEAKAAYQKLINDFPSSRDITTWQKKVEELNIKLIFSPVLTPKSTLYEIKPGDTLTKIAKEFKTTTELIMKSNNLMNDKIVPGKKVKVATVPFSILVYKGQNLLVLKTDDEVIKTYVVSTGKNNTTPVGTFKVTNKLQNPTWFKAGAVVAAGSPENILGTRWLGWNVAGYGIHGTTEPQYLGQQVTQGCVRMANQEVEELYAIVPVDTEVVVVD